MRVKHLKEIGIRAGITTDKNSDKSNMISVADAQKTISWLRNRYGIELPFPDLLDLGLEIGWGRIKILVSVSWIPYGILSAIIFLALVNVLFYRLPTTHSIQGILKPSLEAMPQTYPREVR